MIEIKLKPTMGRFRDEKKVKLFQSNENKENQVHLT